MSDQVRLLVGLENLQRKARRRQRECEREEGRPDGRKGARYTRLLSRIADEMNSFDRAHLEDYLRYVEETLLPRIASRVEKTKEEMIDAGRRIVDGKAHLAELRGEYTDALDRVRQVRERLGLDPFQPLEAHFGFGMNPPNVDRPTREAYDLVKGYLRS